MRESDKLPDTLFTPAAKNSTGHDENITFEEVERRLGERNAHQVRRLTLELYESARRHAEACDLILADTKFEFGTVRDEDGKPSIVLADEALTPDSTRYWLASAYSPGGPQPSFDKQYVRDYLQQSGWDKRGGGPVLPPDVIANTRRKYLDAFTMLTGRTSLDDE